jgi:DNA (cytosine-5)-methyltransferase 1
MNKIIRLGNVYGDYDGGNFYDVRGICASITSGGATRQPMILDSNNDSNNDDKILIKQATKKGYIECVNGGIADLSYPTSLTRRGRVCQNGECSPTLPAMETNICRIEKQAIETFESNDCKDGDIIDSFNKRVNKSGICPTITTRPEGLKTAILPVINYRIRKLTPRECWRLMGFTDKDFDNAQSVNSNSQLYKQSGNSIVVDVLYYLFKSIIDTLKKYNLDYKPIRLIELFSGVGSQASALNRLGFYFKCYKTSEWEVNAVASYNAIHQHDYRDYAKDMTDEQLNDALYQFGISTNGKSPLSMVQIKRKSREWKKKVYNDFHATNNIGSITNIHASDLQIRDVVNFTYLLTYSFPCQDLSVAGKQRGMAKGSNTRSGMLWEVERILKECEELPQILVMENVPQVHGKKFINDFNKWIESLESLGYTNYYQDLNSKDYGVAQHRNRTFMVSFLGKYDFDFPKPFELKKTMKDYLEDKVDDKYYITSERADNLINQLIVKGQLPSEDEKVATDFTINNPNVITTSNCITARYDCGISNYKQSGVGIIEKK